MLDLTEEFFEAFEIEKTSFDFICNKNKCNKKRLFGRFSCLECDNETKKEIKVYSKINAEILLKLICVLNEYGSTIGVIIQSKDLKDLKNEVLKECVRQNEIVFKQVQVLFKECGNE